MASYSTNSIVPPPPYRRLRGYSFDPSLSIQLDTALINCAVFKVKWEDKNSGLKPGPVGEYLEVIDYDPASKIFYEPIDLDDPYVLAQDGLSPSESNPLFHQQMVYAVAMTTIQNFEKALGRPIQWAPYIYRNADKKIQEDYTGKLRIYPHALREANAYYSPEKVALLFGYFPAAPLYASDHLPGGLVFTCLSHDVVAHETTHAILDGLHRRYVEPIHEDTLAFHEAFADIVALFQHFSFTEVLEHQITKTRGDLQTENLLGQLAQQFGKAIGNHGALRDAIGEKDLKTGEWKLKKPDPNQIRTTFEPHDRGSILVATIFDAFISIYRKRSRDLIRIASGGTGELASGDIHPDLVKRLAQEASKTAKHLLNICIRAIDYCPPIEISFGDYLRGLITADADLVPDDSLDYRIALIEAFKRRGIYPEGIKNLSIESLRYPDVDIAGMEGEVEIIAGVLRAFQDKLSYIKDRELIYDHTKKKKEELHERLEMKLENPLFENITGISFTNNLNGEIKMSGGVPRFEVHSLKRARRVGPDGTSINQMIVTLTQQRIIRDSNNAYGIPKSLLPYRFRGGSTLIFDLDTLDLKYAITKSIFDNDRIKRQLAFLTKWDELSFESKGFRVNTSAGEPFAFLHKI